MITNIIYLSYYTSINIYSIFGNGGMNVYFMDDKVMFEDVLIVSFVWVKNKGKISALIFIGG